MYYYTMFAFDANVKLAYFLLFPLQNGQTPPHFSKSNVAKHLLQVTPVTE